MTEKTARKFSIQIEVTRENDNSGVFWYPRVTYHGDLSEAEKVDLDELVHENLCIWVSEQVTDNPQNW